MSVNCQAGAPPQYKIKNLNKQMKLETDRLILLPISADNFEKKYELFTNSFIKNYLFDNEIVSQETVRSFIETSIQNFQQKYYGLWTIHVKKTDSLIGFTGLWHFFDETQPQLLYALLPKHTKFGYAREAALKVIDYAWENLKLDFLDASCDTLNLTSVNVAIGIGMTKTKEELIDNKPITFFRIYKNEN